MFSRNYWKKSWILHKFTNSTEETYDIIKKTHLALNHAGRDKMQKEINRKYANITLNCINLYKSLYEECQNYIYIYMLQ
jgi:hypothetical protein